MASSVSRFLLILGIFCLIFAAFLIWQRNNPNRLSFAINHVNYESTSGKNNPSKLIIKDFELELPIYPASLDGGKWQATTQGVSYLTSSAVPGDIGNSILYGHNWPNLLGKLPRVKPGQEITIVFTDGSSKNFNIEYTSVVTPDQTHILNPTADRRITLYTCTGLFDNKRFVVTAVNKPYN